MINERIKQARLLSGMTQSEVVSKLGEHGIKLTKGGLSKYERGGSVPSTGVLLKLANVLSVKTNYFFEDPSIKIQWLAYRKHVSLGKKRQEQIQAFAAEVLNGQLWLQEKLYPNDIPSFPKREKVKTFNAAENTAAKLRNHWNLSDTAIESLTGIIEDRGGVVINYPYDNKDFQGFSGWANKKYAVAVVCGQSPVDRCRFSLAHELGHLMMDNQEVDPKYEEKLTYRFAAAFIVPSSVAFRELGEHRRRLSFQELSMLKRKHGLSMQAWIRRAFDLGIIKEGHYRSLNIELRSRGWHKKEPIEYNGEELPSKLKQMTLRALSEGIITPIKAEELCPGCKNDIQLPAGDEPMLYRSAIDAMNLPKKERESLLEESALLAEKVYSENPELYNFRALGDEDWVDD